MTLNNHNYDTNRLNKALHDTEKLKEKLKQQENSVHESNGANVQELQKLKVENKKLVQQKNELLAAFKKQLRLIDVLRRQKVVDAIGF